MQESKKVFVLLVAHKAELVVGFETEEELFVRDAEGKDADAVFRHHSVAGYQDRERIGSAGCGYRTCGAGIAYAARQIRVSDGGGIGDMCECLPHRLLKRRAKRD